VTMSSVMADTNKKHLVTKVVVTFSGAVNSAEADLTGTYRLATAGKKGSYIAKNAQVIKLKSASFNAANDTVTLTPKKAFALTKPVQLVVNGTPPSGLHDSFGRFIDGGNNSIAILRRGGATIEVVAAVESAARLALEPAAVDIVLDREHQIGTRHRALVEHAGHEHLIISRRPVHAVVSAGHV
jgi:hypothetical protein